VAPVKEGSVRMRPVYIGGMDSLKGKMRPSPKGDWGHRIVQSLIAELGLST